MKAFADLYQSLDESALRRYFSAASPADAAWAVYLLSGHKPRRVVTIHQLILWAVEAAEIPDWLFEESLQVVGDRVETLTLILPDPADSSRLSLREWMENRLLPLHTMDEDTQKEAIQQRWRELDAPQRLVMNKLLTGTFRVGISLQTLTSALSDVCGVEAAILAQRLTMIDQPTADFYRRLIAPDISAEVCSRPYPFGRAFPILQPAVLGDVQEWQAEWKWDGLRVQVIHRQGQVFIWSRGESWLTTRCPEVADFAHQLPDGTVLDGELLAWKNGSVMALAALERRLGIKTLTKKLLADVPVVLMAYDVLEAGGEEVRGLPLHQRRVILAELHKMTHPHFLMSPVIEADSWDALADAHRTSRRLNVAGLMLKRRDSPYGVDWWAWKLDPYSVKAVLMYAGRDGRTYSEYTLGVWNQEGQLIPVAKVTCDLAEMEALETFIRQNTLERFGPVRTVKPALVFELAFEGIQRSARHKSGVVLRLPRLVRWQQDIPIEDADTLDALHALLP
jgi:DNA ligase-1